MSTPTHTHTYHPTPSDPTHGALTIRKHTQVKAHGGQTPTRHILVKDAHAATHREARQKVVARETAKALGRAIHRATQPASRVFALKEESTPLCAV